MSDLDYLASIYNAFIEFVGYEHWTTRSNNMQQLYCDPDKCKRSYVTFLIVRLTQKLTVGCVFTCR